MPEVTKRDKPAQQPFVDQFVEAPFQELSQLGQQLAKEKSVKRAALRDISDDLLGIKATDEDRATRDRIIGSFKSRIDNISKSPARNQEAEISQLADSIEFEVNFGNLGQIKTNFDTDVENRKQETTLRTKDRGEGFDEDFSLAPARNAFKEIYGNREDFQPDQSNLDEDGNVKVRSAVVPRVHHDVNKFFTPTFKALKSDLIQTAELDREGGVITTTKTGGIDVPRLYGVAFNQVVNGLVPDFLEDQMREEIGQLPESRVLEMAKRAINNIPFSEDEEPAQLIADMTPDEVLEFAMIDRIAKIGKNQLNKLNIVSKKSFGKGGLRFGGGGRAGDNDFNYTANVVSGNPIGVVNPFFADIAGPSIVNTVNFREILISKKGADGTGKNRPIPITNPNDVNEKIDVVPLSFRQPQGSDEWFIWGERKIDRGQEFEAQIRATMEEQDILRGQAIDLISQDPDNELSAAEAGKLKKGQKVIGTVQDLYPYELVRKDFANNYNNIFLEDLEPDKLFGQVDEAPAAAPTPAPAPAVARDQPVKINPTDSDTNALIVDQLYDIGGRIVKWNGANFIPQ